MKILKITIDGVDYAINHDLAVRAGLIRPAPENAPCWQPGPIPPRCNEGVESAFLIVVSALIVALAIILWGCL